MAKQKSKGASRCKVDRKTLALAKKGDGDALLAVGCAAYTNGDYETAMKYYEATLCARLRSGVFMDFAV